MKLRCLTAPKRWSHIKSTVALTILTFRHIQRLHLMYAEIAWVLVSSETQVQPHVILDPDYLPDYLSVCCDYAAANNFRRNVSSQIIDKVLNTSLNLSIFKSSHQRCSVQICVIRNFKNLTGKDLCQRLFLIKLQAKKETLAEVFSCEFCEIPKNTFFTEHLWTTVSIFYRKRTRMLN